VRETESYARFKVIIVRFLQELLVLWLCEQLLKCWRKSIIALS